MDKVEVKVTWGLAWGIWWRWTLIGIIPLTIIYLIIFAIIGAVSLYP